MRTRRPRWSIAVVIALQFWHGANKQREPCILAGEILRGTQRKETERTNEISISCLTSEYFQTIQTRSKEYVASWYRVLERGLLAIRPKLTLIGCALGYRYRSIYNKCGVAGRTKQNLWFSAYASTLPSRIDVATPAPPSALYLQIETRIYEAIVSLYRAGMLFANRSAGTPAQRRQSPRAPTTVFPDRAARHVYSILEWPPIYWP